MSGLRVEWTRCGDADVRHMELFREVSDGMFDVRFPDEEVARHLIIDITDPVYEIRRVRYVDNEPYVIENTFMSSSLITGVTKEVLDSSIYRYIREDLGYTITSSHKMIRSDKPDQWDRDYLGDEDTDSIIEVEQVVFLRNWKPFEYSFSWHRHDKFIFTSVHIGR